MAKVGVTGFPANLPWMCIGNVIPVLAGCQVTPWSVLRKMPPPHVLA